jgi:plasmid stability protein
VYTINVKNITLSAPEDLIERARLRAARESKTLNAAFREWLDRYAGVETGRQEYAQLMKGWRHVKNGKRFSRDEMNER